MTPAPSCIFAWKINVCWYRIDALFKIVFFAQICTVASVFPTESDLNCEFRLCTSLTFGVQPPHKEVPSWAEQRVGSDGTHTCLLPNTDFGILGSIWGIFDTGIRVRTTNNPPSHPDWDCLLIITLFPLLVFRLYSVLLIPEKSIGEGWRQDWLLNQELCWVAEISLHGDTPILQSYNSIPVTLGALLLRPPLFVCFCTQFFKSSLGNTILY